MADKITYKTILTKVINGDVLSTEEEIAKAKALLASLEKKSDKKKTENPNDAIIKARILEVLKDGAKTIGEMIACGGFPTNENGLVSTQMISPRANALCDANLIAKNTVKGKTVFSLISTVDVAEDGEVDE